jgi:hypothetical protein
MENYLNNFVNYKEIIIYNFNNKGGIGDFIKFFIYLLEDCIKNNKKLFFLINNLEIENHIKLKFKCLYITKNKLNEIEYKKIIEPGMLYNIYNTNFNLQISDVFYFSNDVIINSNKLINSNFKNYISIHLRLGDKYLDSKFILCKNDSRKFIEENIFKIIENNIDKNIFFCCDNNSYKLKLKKKYDNITITNCKIGHSALEDTSKEQILNSVSEFYILTKSNLIYRASQSGYSLIASKFNNIHLIDIF